MNREGGYVSLEEDIHRPLLVVITPLTVLVENEPVPQLGFQHDQALRASRTFARELYSLSNVLEEQARKASPPFAPDYQKLQESLRLNVDTSWTALHKLQKIGEGMRASLSREMVEQLMYSGFHFLKDPIAEEPALTFQEGEKAPTLWEMMYEYEDEQSSSPDWQRFWGFRVPITHWMHTYRTDIIWLRNGLFSAINEDLPFASREETELAQRLQPGLSKYSLKEEFRKRVLQEMRNHMQDDELEVWLAECQSGSWLRCFLDQLEPSVEMHRSRVESWKEDTLLSICQKGFRQELIHFACHCEASEETEFLSRLVMKVAGETVPLDVSFMATRLRRERLSSADPGSLVFLNACGTGQQSASYEPPGFPDKWISNQRALAVVATLCPVPDYFAHVFALKFYDILFEAITAPKNSPMARNRYVAKALLETRRYFMQEYNNPLGLAYVLYAVRGARVEVDLLRTGGTS